jgi:cyclic pyranopterin phosphate synthase
MLARLPVEITLTTNGSLLKKKAQALKDAGLHRVTVSLDGIDDAVFKRMNDVDFPVGDVLDGIAAAAAAGLAPIKVNCVVKRGTNDDQILPLARHFRHSGHILRFIEYMDVGSSNGWRMDEVLPSARSSPASMPNSRSKPSTPTTPARSPSAGATRTAAARSASSPR